MRPQPLHAVSRRLLLTVGIYEGGRRSETEQSRVELPRVEPCRVEPCRVVSAYIQLNSQLVGAD
jgi:hypothetical protein